ncbi:hypothetical protein WKG77_18660, partial [Bordetella pertussis]
GKIIKHLTQKVDMVDYLTAGYASYAAGLVSALVKSGGLVDRHRDELIASLMKSVFSDVAVVVSTYFDELNSKAEAARRQGLT